jgi:ferredoxin
MRKKIVFCNCGGTLLKEEYKEEIIGSLKKENIAFIMVSDLCGLCVSQKQDISNLLSSSGEILIVACHPRAVKVLLNNYEIESEASTLQFTTFLKQDAAHLLEEIRTFLDNEENTGLREEIKTSSDWPAWYPLIDYSRCSACGQCADFCLFGVFERNENENEVRVVNPQGCKNNCPACARICPSTAIIFPKYEQGGAIAGDEAINEMEELLRQQKDLDEILGGEIYQALEKRKLKRQSIIRNDALQEAIKEREQALIKKMG